MPKIVREMISAVSSAMAAVSSNSSSARFRCPASREGEGHLFHRATEDRHAVLVHDIGHQRAAALPRLALGDEEPSPSSTSSARRICGLLRSKFWWRVTPSRI